MSVMNLDTYWKSHVSLLNISIKLFGFMFLWEIVDYDSITDLNLANLSTLILASAY